MKTETSQPKHTQGVDIEKLASTLSDCSGYERNEANAYERGIISGYEKALLNNSKAVNMHDELVGLLGEIKEWSSQYGLKAELFDKMEQLLKQAEGK